jgi:hypothetical protein
MGSVLITNNLTGEVTTVEDISQEVIAPTEQPIPDPTIEERLQAAEEALLTLISLGGL